MTKKIFLIIFTVLYIFLAVSLFSGCRASSNNPEKNTRITETELSQPSRTILSQSTETLFGQPSETKPGQTPESKAGQTSETKPGKSGPSSTSGISKLQNKETLSSGAITVLPWQNEDKFKKSQAQNGTYALLAAFRTVLRDPLPGEEYNVHLAARLISGSVVKPGRIFSQNQKAGPYTKSRGFQIGPTYIGTKLKTTVGGGVCKIASTLYNVTVLSNLQVVERYAHSMPVPYVPYGQDATVSYGVHDFKFKNNTSEPVLIWAQGIDNILYIAFYGKNKPPEVKWHHETLKVQKESVIYRKNSSLKPGFEKVVTEGMHGATVRSWVTIKKPDGTYIKKQLETSHYAPMAKIIEKGG